MQTLIISRTGGRSNYTLSPTRNTGELQDKLAKCNGKSRKSAIRDTRTKGNFPRFEAGMSTADYVRAFESDHLCAWQWEQLNEEPCTLYSGEDTCETLPDGFDTWEDFDAAQGSSTADAEPVDAAEPVAPDDAIAPAIVASADPYPGCEPAAAIVYRVHLATAAHSRAIDPAFNGYRRPRSACMLADFAAPAVRAHRLAIARSVRAERAKRASLEGSEPQRMADAMRSRIAPTADALREAAAELEARAARVPTERADDYRGAAAMLRADADAAPGIVPGFASRGARMLQAAIARSAARGIEDPNGAPVAAVESDTPPDPEPGAGGAPLATHSQTAPVADPLATHFSTSDNVGRVRYLVSYHDGRKVHSDGSPFYDVATFKNRRARDAFCRDLRARGYTEGAHADPLPSESEPNPVPGKLDAAPAVDSGPPASDSSADPAEVKREADRAAALADAMARFTRGARVTAEPAHYFDGRPVAGWPNAQFLGTVRECFDNRGMATVRVKWDSGRTDLTSAARLAIVPLPSEFGPDPLPGESARVFSVIVARPGKRALQYAPVGGETALANMLRMSTRGFECIARTTANEITEDLTAPEMLALYGALSGPVPGDTKPEALDDDETIPAPLDGLDVAELDDMVEFERAGGATSDPPATHSDRPPPPDYRNTWHVSYRTSDAIRQVRIRAAGRADAMAYASALPDCIAPMCANADDDGPGYAFSLADPRAPIPGRFGMRGIARAASAMRCA